MQHVCVDMCASVHMCVQAIPRQRVATIQRTIAEHAHRLHEAFDNYDGDAIDLALLDLARLGRQPRRGPLPCQDYGRCVNPSICPSVRLVDVSICRGMCLHAGC